MNKLKSLFFKGILSVFLLLSISASAESIASLVFQTQELRVVLLSGVCKAKEVLDFINPQYHSVFREAMVTYQGEFLKACWTVLPDGTVGIMDQVGDSGKIPLDAFVPENKM